jgi:hypothetical protein|tara:strand:- start:57 stop:638 length:582 start_codon:yes stop_codon:yes gene_type:complete
MSAFVASADCLNALATYWERKASHRGGSAEDALMRAVMNHRLAYGNRSDDYAADLAADREAAARLLKIAGGLPLRAVFLILLAENENSLKARYGDEPGDNGPEYVGRSLPIVDRWMMARKTGQLVGLLNGYTYQACEHDEWEKSIAYFICQQIRDHLLRDFEARDCGSEGLWASWSAPAEGPGPVRLSTLAKS